MMIIEKKSINFLLIDNLNHKIFTIFMGCSDILSG